MVHWNYSHCYWTEFSRLRREGCDASQARAGALALADGEMMGLVDTEGQDFSIMGLTSRRKTRTYYHLQYADAEFARRKRCAAIRSQLECGPFYDAFLAGLDDYPTST